MSTGAGKRERPRGLWVLGVGAILYGVLGACGGASGFAGSVNQQQQMEQMRQMQGTFGDEEGGAFMERIVEETERWTPLGYALQAVNLVVALALGAVGVLALQWHPLTPRVGPSALAFCALFVLAATLLELWMQQAMMGAMFGSMPTPAGPGSGDLERMSSAITAFALCCGGGWGGVKLAFAAWGAAYLRKPEVGRLFGAPEALGPRGE